MSNLDTNVFPILNLKDFETTYQKVAITGLNPDDQEFYSNKMQLQRRLTSKYKQPILIIGDGVYQYAVAPNTIKIFGSAARRGIPVRGSATGGAGEEMHNPDSRRKRR